MSFVEKRKGNGKEKEDEGGGGKEKEELRLWSCSMPVGSVVVLEGDAADEYLHALPPMSSRRISLTFRHLSDAQRSREEDAVAKKEADRIARGIIAVTSPYPADIHLFLEIIQC